ncbi:MAG: two-component regulator propeller domain-containing protein, partial [Dehalococcoidia bacterium]|nr:two-component regulator propeller domain-containing protein [Dehalococcoidia bacterium]
MKKFTVQSAVILLVLVLSILIVSCQPQPTVSWSPIENDAGWTLFTNSSKVQKLLAEGNALWAATSGGVVKWDLGKGTYRKYTTLDGLASNDVRSVGRDNQGNLWFGTIGGLSRYDGTNWRTFTTNDGLASNIVTAIAQDVKGNLWFGTMGAGVTCYDGTNWRTFTTKDGLGHNAVNIIARDNQGNLWF